MLNIYKDMIIMAVMTKPFFLINEFLSEYNTVETLKLALYKKAILMKDYKDDNLLLLYTKFNTSIISELQRECRSLIIDRTTFKIISYSCETPIINTDAYIYLNNIYKKDYSCDEIDIDNIINVCYEGCLISIFNNNNKWYFSTRRNLIKEDLDLTDNKHFLMFINTLKNIGYDNFNNFCKTLDKNKSYYYVLIHYENKNIIDYSYIFDKNYMKLCLISIRDSDMTELGLYSKPLYSCDPMESIFITPKDSFKNFMTYKDQLIEFPEKFYNEGIIIKHFDSTMNKYKLIKLQTLAYQFMLVQFNESNINSSDNTLVKNLNIYKGLLFLYQNNKLCNYLLNPINNKYKNIYQDNICYNLIGIIDATFKCLSLELSALCNNLWGDTSKLINLQFNFSKLNCHNNKDLYYNLSKNYKDVLYKIKGLYFRHKKLSVHNVYTYIKTININKLTSLLFYRLLLYKLFNFSCINDKNYNIYTKLCFIFTNKLVEKS